jgi:GNAT superfamily N-acetyltransferase
MAVVGVMGVVRRKVISLSPERLEKIPEVCRKCRFWESGGVSSLANDCSVKMEWLKNTSETWGECGKLIIKGDQVIAFSIYAPANCFPDFKPSMAGPVSNDAALLACLYVVPQLRRQGVGRTMLQVVAKSLLRRKLTAIEAYASRSGDFGIPLDFCLANGFFILRDDPRFPLVRLELKNMIPWLENLDLQTALQTLNISSLRHRLKVPVSLF